MKTQVHSRRNFIRLIGGGVIAAAGIATLAGVSRDAMPEVAVAPWVNPGTGETDPRRHALSFALLAPNPHNLQSWLVALRGRDEIMLYCDRARLLPHTDPFSRQIMIGHGAFLEVLDLAAEWLGYATETTLFPEGEFGETVDARPVARVRFVRQDAIAEDPLFTHVASRRSHKGPFDLRRTVAAISVTGLLTSIRQPEVAAGFTVDPARLPALRKLTADAIRVECATPRTLKESIDLLRVGADEIAAHRDGISLHGPMFWWLSRLGMMSKESSLDPTSSSHKGTVKSLCENPETAMGFVWLTTAGNRRADQIAAGRAHVRANLEATRIGLQMHPVSQALQEYIEMDTLRAELKRQLTVPDGHTLQMLSRVGYANPAPRAPRRGLVAHIISDI